MSRLRWPILAFALSWILAGCFQDERVAGGDDFPNSVETLGKGAAGETSDSTEWNAYREAPSTPPEVYDSTEVPDSAPEESAGSPGKAAVPPDGRIPPGREISGAVRNVVSAVDGATGLGRAVRVQTLAGIEARDTTWYRIQLLPPAKKVVRVSGVVTYATGRSERFSFEDADGDSLLPAQAGSANRVRVRFVVEYALGRVEERTFTIAAGPDLAFGSRGDNILYASQTVHRLGSDTLYSLRLRAANASPSDSAVYDPQRDSGRVEVEQTISTPGVRTTLSYRTVLFADSARNHAVRFRRVVTTARGVTETRLLGRDSLPDFAPGDTGRVRVVFASTVPSDTLESARFEYRVALSDTAGRHSGNRLLRVDREKSFRFGTATGLRYRLSPAAPVASGSFARAGGVDVRVDLRAGGWVGFTGTSAATGFSGTWTGSAGGGGTVHFDAAGNIVSAPAAP